MRVCVVVLWQTRRALEGQSFFKSSEGEELGIDRIIESVIQTCDDKVAAHDMKYLHRDDQDRSQISNHKSRNCLTLV